MADYAVLAEDKTSSQERLDQKGFTFEVCKKKKKKKKKKNIV